ncbi:hypothetical protein V1478_007178, partial [Vespula squamosa]
YNTRWWLRDARSSIESPYQKRCFPARRIKPVKAPVGPPDYRTVCHHEDYSFEDFDRRCDPWDRSIGISSTGETYASYYK